jgi:hypothetical protein
MDYLFDRNCYLVSGVVFMKFVYFNPEREDLVYSRFVKSSDKLIIDMKDRYDRGINFSELKQKYRRISQLWLQEWSKTKIGGKDVKDIFSHNGKHYFYLLSYFFQRYFEKEGLMYRNTSGAQHILMMIDLLDDFVDEEFTVISRDPNDDLFLRLALSVATKKGFRIIMYNLPYKNHGFVRNTKILNLGMRLRSRLMWLIGDKCGQPFRISLKNNVLDLNPPVEKRKVVLLSSTRFSRRRPEDNIIFGNLVKELECQGVPFKIIDYAPLNSKKLITLSENSLGNYYTLKVLKDNDKLHKIFKDKWLKIRESPELKKSLSYNGVNFYLEILPLFDLLFNDLFYVIADNINLTKSMVEFERPSCVVIDSEENFYGKGVIINNKCPVVALQHEAVLPGDSNLAHITGSNKGRPLPTIKCVGGSASKEILLNECNYPANKIRITGRSEFDDLITNKTYMKRKYGRGVRFDVTSDVILYAPEYISVTKEFYKVIKNIKGFRFVIKPHPMMSMKDFPEQKNVDVVDKNENVHELINECNLVVTTHCTVAQEALLASTPVINYNPFNYTDPWKLRRAGVPEAYNDKELIKLIKGYKKIKIKPKTKKYLYDQLYKPDGQASKRIVEVIKSVI